MKGLTEIEEIMERVGPYLSNMDEARKLIIEAMESVDPLKHLEEKLRSSEGLLRGDIRIILNCFRK